MCDQQSLRSVCAYTQFDQSLCLSLEYSMSVKLLTEHHLEFLSLKGGCTGSFESTLVKIPHCLKSYAAAHMISAYIFTVAFFFITSDFSIHLMHFTSEIQTLITFLFVSKNIKCG